MNRVLASDASKLVHQKVPCDECPWRRDVAVGRFTARRFESLVPTAEDMGQVLFACHKSQEGKDAACAGFLLRGARHNYLVRMAIATGRYDPSTVSEEGCELYESFTEMALANGARSEKIRKARAD